MKTKTKKAKRLVYLTLLCMFALFACGCSSDPKNFGNGDITVTLTKEFSEQKNTNFDMYLASDDVVFSAVQETTAELETSGYEINSLQNYCSELLAQNNVPKDSLVQKSNYYYYTNEQTISGANYTYVHCFFKGQDSYWICEFVCKTKSYNRYKDDIFKWADSIEVK